MKKALKVRQSACGAAAIFLGAFVAFALEPLVGRTLLPGFGGVASVWVTCLTVFQLLLVGGYFYAHRICRSRGGVRLHLALIFGAALWLGAAGGFWQVLTGVVSASFPPSIGTLLAVLSLGAVPFVILGANSSLVQVLAAGDYRLYAVSNLGSFAGLLAYPLLLEPFVGISAQWGLLAALTAGYAVLVAVLWRQGGNRIAFVGDVPEASAAGGSSEFLWYAIPAVTCFLLNAATTHLTSNVAPIPLLWAILLGAYLLSYVIGFSGFGEKTAPVLLWCGVAASVVASLAMARGPGVVDTFLRNFAAVTAVIAVGCSGLHGWLYRLRPAASGLTRYYLALAIGGATGGLLAGIVVPLVSTAAVEYPLALVAVGLLSLKGVAEPVRHAKSAALLLVPLAAWYGYSSMTEKTLGSNRSFYGVWRVERTQVSVRYGLDGGETSHACIAFYNGGTAHGLKVCEGFCANAPTLYYGRGGGGLCFTEHPLRKAGRPIRAAIVGMGVGIMSCWGEAGDTIRFYEIDPQVAAVAQAGTWFDFLKKSPAKVEIVVDDARKALERERDADEERYDLLVVDAYSGDSIPMHLITEEAFRLYRSRLKDGGVLALHITNWHMDLRPVCRAAAMLLGWDLRIVRGRGGDFQSSSEWAFVSAMPLAFSEPQDFVDMSGVRETALPSDGCGSVLKYLKIVR